LLSEGLEGHVLLGALRLQGGEGLREGGQTIIVVRGGLGIVEAVIPCVLCGLTVAFPLSILQNSEVFEDMPLDCSGIGVKAGKFLHFVLELPCPLDDGQGSIDELVGVERTVCSCRENLLGFDVAGEVLDGGGWIPLV
jgi:hypothetical protein